MTWAYVAVGAGTLISGYLGSQSSKKAAGAAQAGSQAAIDEARRQFDLVRGDTAGLRFIGNAATDRLARLYGYGPGPNSVSPSSPAGVSGPQLMPGSDGGSAAHSFLRSGVTNSARGLVDPVGGPIGLVKGGLRLFGSQHGDEKRNLNAFLKDNPVYELGDGKLALSDGTVLTQDDLQGLAGAWYGAKFAPDGNQAGWQRTYDDTLSGLISKYNRTSVAQGTQGTQAAPAAGSPSGPDMSAFFESPDYQFNLAEGQKALDRSASARGGLLSGGAVKEGVRYASGLASREYSNFVDRLMQQAGLGTTGIGASASAGMSTAGIVGNAAVNGGNARGSAYLTGANALNSSVQGGLQNFLLARYLGG